MNYLRCKCGKITSYSSYTSAKPCDGCKECNTNLAIHPSSHLPLAEHVYEDMYNITTGKSYKRCSVCDEVDVVSYKESCIK